MTQYLILIYERESGYAEGGPEVWEAAGKAHGRFAEQVGEKGGQMLGGVRNIFGVEEGQQLGVGRHGLGLDGLLGLGLERRLLRRRDRGRHVLERFPEEGVLGVRRLGDHRH